MTDLNNDQGLDNQQYYEQILHYLEDPTQENINIQWVKVQAANYFLRDGELFYGRRRPRKVVFDEHAKTEILQQIHIDTKGFHNGVKKMHRILQKKHFWRYSYKSISEYVQNCALCKSNDSPIINIEKPYKSLAPWKEIEFHQLKPTSQSSHENHLLFIIYDPTSSWVSAAVLKPCSCDMAEFLFENFCNYGVALCTVYGLNSFQFMELKEEFNKLISIAEAASIFDGKNDVLKFSDKESAEFNTNLKPRIDAYLLKHPEDWNKRIAILGWLWKLRNEMMNNTTALSAMSKHCFDKKSNAAGNPLAKLRKKTSRLHLDGKFSDSAVVLQSHLPCSEERFTRSSNLKHRGSQHNSKNNQTENDSVNYSVDDGISTSTTVAAVRALIAQSKEVRKSKEERQKRGEYNSYTPEIREAIAIHALRHGTHSAARTFSTSLGISVSYSSVRNFVQAHHAFSSQLKLEIGRYAAECGIDATQKLYASKLDKPISTALIRKFRRNYLRMTPTNQSDHHSGIRKSTSTVARHLFCTSVREEIGKYAAIHGVQAAVRHFSDKLQFSVKESTVRKFKKIFGSPAVHQNRSQPNAPTIPPSPPILPHSHSSPVSVHPSLSLLHQQTPDPNYYHQPYGHFTNTHMYVSQQPVNNYNNHHQNMYHVMVPSQPVPPYPSYSSLPPPPQYQPSVTVPLPAYSRNWNEECSEVSTPFHHQPSDISSTPTCLTITRPPSIATVNPLPPPPPLPPPLELNPATSRISVRQEKIAERKKKLKKSGRGSYATYSPQFRLEVGRFAVEYSCQEAADHFKKRVGHEIPESTIRGLRDKYVSQQRATGEEVSSLNVLPRGRPLRLGPHDEAVQECIRELKRSGERVNAFVAMATARQVLLQKEPSLLTEFGGPVKLTTNWAKSFLKRIGINKENSSQKNDTLDNPPTQTE